MVRDGKPESLFLAHRKAYGRHDITTCTHMTPANVHEPAPFRAREPGFGSGSGYERRAQPRRDAGRHVAERTC